MTAPHFTYNVDKDTATLSQGDLLAKTPELEAVLAEYHSYYTLEKYTHFIVLTQTCDLVRRSSAKGCKSRYISIAAVRGLGDVIVRETATALGSINIDGQHYCNDSKKSAAGSMLNRLLNNNHSDYFFLKSMPEVGVMQDSCAFLHLSIAIKSAEHYQKMLGRKGFGVD